jgi:hypothetical protein
MLGENAGRILHRHLIAGKRHHFTAPCHMQVIERSTFQIGCCVGPGDSTSSSRMSGTRYL